MNLIKILSLLILLTSVVGAQQTAPNTKTPESISPPSTTNTSQQPTQPPAPKKERTDQILVDPFSGTASTTIIDVNTNPDLANFVDQTLVGVIVGEKKRLAILQSAQGQISRFKINEKINSEYKILEIYKDRILVASLDKNEYEVYFNNVIKPVEKKVKSIPKKPAKLDKQLEDSLNSNVDPLAPKIAPKKETPVKKPAVKKVKEQIDDSYKPDLEPKVVREESDLNKSVMEKETNIDVEKIKEKLKK